MISVQEERGRKRHGNTISLRSSGTGGTFCSCGFKYSFPFIFDFFLSGFKYSFPFIFDFFTCLQSLSNLRPDLEWILRLPLVTPQVKIRLLRDLGDWVFKSTFVPPPTSGEECRQTFFFDLFDLKIQRGRRKSRIRTGGLSMTTGTERGFH